MKKKKKLRFERARQPEQIEQRLEQILEAAMVLFWEKGLENVTLTDIANKAGPAKHNLDRYCESREHIYLVTLQKVADEWEKKIRAQLQELAGKGTVSKVADMITDSFIQARPYSGLITVINTVLEKKLSPKLVANFRSAFLERSKRISADLAAALPGATAETIFPLALQIFTLGAAASPRLIVSPPSAYALARP